MIKEIDKGQICTERLYLRRFTDDDIDAYSAIMESDEIGKWLPKGKGFSREETERMLKRFAEHWEKYGFGVWAVTDRENDVLMGHCGLNTIVTTSEVEVLYALHPAFWGKGIATEAAGASLEYGLDYLNLDRIIALSKPENVKSRRVIEKIGLKYNDCREYFKMECAYYEST